MRDDQGMGSPISNEAYNVISALHSKLEELDAYRTYQHDGGGFWEELSFQDNRAVELLVGELERLVGEGRLRSGEEAAGRPALWPEGAAEP